jgi:hypothetical protein
MRNPFKRMKDPVEGRMHVLGCDVINPDAMRASCHITYMIQAEGVAAFSGDRVFELWCMQWPDPGDHLPVVFDRERTDHIQILWNRVQTHVEPGPLHAEQSDASDAGMAGDAPAVAPAVATPTPYRRSSSSAMPDAQTTSPRTGE